MRIFTSLLTFALLALPAAGVFSQDMYGTGLYASAGGGVTLITDLEKVKQSDGLGSSDGKEADWDLDFGFGAGGAIGYDFGDFRTDAEFSYQSAGFLHDEKIEGSKKANDTLVIIAILANGFFDLDTGTPFFPYIGIGAGAVNLQTTLNEMADSKDPQFRGSGWGFGYQANLGVGFQIIDEIALTLGYKFFGTLETKVTDPGKDSGTSDDMYVQPTLMAHRAELGVRFSF